jgi:hypothetical protein
MSRNNFGAMVRRAVDEFRSLRNAVHRSLTGGNKAPIEHALAKAIEHGEAALQEMRRLPDRRTQRGAHDKAIVHCYAHVKAAERYLDNHRSYPLEPADTPDIEPADPEAKTARANVRAFAAVVAQGLGRR